ncbi:MAG: GNAT family N-acetyltransferase [Oligoflexus sp.]|nr:GNAT family N-acetyltransferase [Oligoflexus sp.]
MIQIKTPRLLLTPAEDIKLFVDEMMRSHVAIQPDIYTRSDVAFDLRDDQLVLWMSDLRSGAHRGGLSIHGIDENTGKYEIGYWLKPEFCGEGLAREAVIVLCEVLFERYRAKKIEIRCDSRNEPSIRLAKDLGFAPEAVWTGKDGADGAMRQSLIFARYDAKGFPSLIQRGKT